MFSNPIYTFISLLILLHHLYDLDRRGRESSRSRNLASLFLEDLGRGGNGLDVDQIVSFPHMFSYLKNKYVCKYRCFRI
jgi:hypothetical protein